MTKKSFLTLISAVLLVFIFIGCGSDSADSAWQPKYKKADKSAEKVSEDIVKANNKLGIEIFSRLAQEEGAKNIMISPLSIAISMAMTANGATGDTLAEMKEVLGFGDMAMSDVNEQFAQLIASLVEADKDMALEIADSVWVDDAFAPGVKEDFISVLEDFYNAALFTEDFEDVETVGKINSWVSEKTHKKIDKMLKEIPHDTLMYLINALYFKAGWTTAFDKESTHAGDFQLSDGSSKKVNYMCFAEEMTTADIRWAFVEDNNRKIHTVVRIPYGRGVCAFYGIVPPDDVDIDDFIAKITDIDSLFGSMNKRDFALTLPKFKFAYEKSLKDTFDVLGIGQIFEGGLENISDVEGLRVSDIRHKTFIEVKEDGTEAAAAIHIEEEASGDPIYYFGTRPFVFVIRDDRTGSILFIGKVEDPTAEQHSDSIKI
jgi:serpin B